LRISPLLAALCIFASASTGADAVSVANINVSGDNGAALANYLSARFAASHNDIGEAAKYFGASLEQDPDNPQLLTYSFIYAASSGDIDQAAKLASRLVVGVPDHREARMTLAVAALKAHDYKGARTQIAQSGKGPFTSFTVALIGGWAAAGQGDKAAAAASLKSLHMQQGADEMAYSNEAMLAELLGDKATAEADYKQALAAGGLSPRLIDAYGRFLERNGRAAEARDLYQKLMADSGMAVIAGPGLLRIAKGTIPPPLIASATDGAAEALFRIAASLNDDTSRDISVLYLRLALYLRPQLDLATVLLASRYEAMEKYEDAIGIYGGIDKDSPYQKYAAVQTAVNLARLDKTDDAIARLKSLSAQYPSDLEIWTALGDAYTQTKKYGEATKAYTSAIKASGPPTKKNWPLYYARGVAEHLTNDWPSAEADFKLALTLSPDQPSVLNYLGYSWVDQRRNIKEALAMLEKARALAPQDGYIVDSVGWAYYHLGRYADAAKALEDAILLVPGDPTINDHLGDAYWKVGRKLDARFQWNHAIAFGAAGPDKSRIEKKLQSGLKGDDRS
jgi:tetratricopeptide (TPR) repeat protein